MTKSEIISKLNTLKVNDENILEEYVDFCVSNSLKYKIKGKSSHHHILPQANFEEYANLNKHEWNGL